MVSYEKMIEDALAEGATAAGIVDVGNIRFLKEVRGLCARNDCGKYATNWMCPPGCGELEECRARVQTYRQGLLIQYVGFVEDFADFEGYARAQQKHEEICRAVFERFRKEYQVKRLLPLTAGGCTICPKCTYPDKPCRLPDQAISSLEAYGMVVNELVTSCGLSYNHGPASVSYVGLALFEA